MTTKVTSSVLANTSVTAGTYGTASLIPIITVDAQGRITSATAATVTGGGGGSGATTYVETKFTATAGQTVFTVNYTVGYVQVYLNGVLLDYATEFTASNGTSITLSQAAALNDIITVFAYTVTSVSNITGGAAGAVLYQAAANTTSNTNVGTTGQLLVSRGAGKPEWIAQTALSIANTQITGLITAAQIASSAIPAGGFSNMQVFTSTGTFTVPTGVTKVKVTVVGGGGGGGGTSGDQAGGGGGGGTTIEIISGLTPAGTVAVTVGVGGTAGSSAGGNGGTGGTSSFGAYCSATGGSGGSGGNEGTGLGSAGGLGSNGNLNIKGGTGINSYGGGGSSFLGGGGTTNGAGGVYGGGGGAANGIAAGGVGAAGVVIVEY